MSKKYTFIHYGYRGGTFAPHLTLLPENSNAFEHLQPLGQTLTLRFDPSQRFCTGWHDLATGESFPCPHTNVLEASYNQCRHCQQKTGFNPAFYHATSVSTQQQARNAQPHFLYLAHFAPGVVKVGISWANRGIARLLDQGARTGLVIKTYPTADQARQYEARIASLPGIAETLQVSAKHKLLSLPYDAGAGITELHSVRDRIKNELNITPEDNDPIVLDTHYGSFDPLAFAHADKPVISGKILGMIGSTLLAEHEGTHFGLALNKYLGCPLHISQELETVDHAPQQTRLF